MKRIHLNFLFAILVAPLSAEPMTTLQRGSGDSIEIPSPRAATPPSPVPSAPAPVVQFTTGTSTSLRRAWDCAAKCKHNDDTYSRTVSTEGSGFPTSADLNGYCDEQGGIGRITCKLTSVTYEIDLEATIELPVTTIQK